MLHHVVHNESVRGDNLGKGSTESEIFVNGTAIYDISSNIFISDCQMFINCVKRKKITRLNIQQLHALPTLYLCVLYLSENKQRLVPLTA